MRGYFTQRESTLLVRQYTGNVAWDSGTSASNNATEGRSPSDGWSVADQVSYCELTGYMRNQLLRDSDVMSMCWGLELRVPFVDRKLMDTISPIDWRIRLAQGKQLLVDAVPEIPEWIRKQPKRGFRFPFEQWAKASWGDWFQSIEAVSPVRCQTWYRSWSLLVLEHFLTANRISFAGKGLGGLRT